MSSPATGDRAVRSEPTRAAQRAASAIYGTIVVTAVIVALSEDPAADATELMEAAATTTLVFWLAHAYSEFLGQRVAARARVGTEGLGRALLRDITMVEAAILPVGALLLGLIHLVSRTHAVTIALVIGVIELFVLGYLAGRGPGSSFLRCVGVGLFNCVLGVAIVLLKALIH